MVRTEMTLHEAFDYFRRQSSLTSGSQAAYSYALQHFHTFLEASESAQDLSLAGPEPNNRKLEELGRSIYDINTLLWFVTYLTNEAVGPERVRGQLQRARGLEPATIRLYGQAMITFFRFLADELILPEAFPATAAISRAQRRLRDVIPASQARDSAPEPPEGIEKLIHAFDNIEISEDLPIKASYFASHPMMCTEQVSTRRESGRSKSVAKGVASTVAQ
jgi:hypothetical protein